MPILRKESEIFPADLFSVPLESAPWEIVHVRSRQEKAVARLLALRRNPYYLPQIEKTVRRSGRIFKSYIPLFSGYLFIRRVANTHRTLWSAAAIARVIRVADQQLLQDELRQIRALQESGATLVPRQDISPGDAVRVTDGAFSGYRGVVIAERDVQRLVVSITALNKSVLAELPRESLIASRRS